MEEIAKAKEEETAAGIMERDEDFKIDYLKDILRSKGNSKAGNGTIEEIKLWVMVQDEDFKIDYLKDTLRGGLNNEAGKGTKEGTF